MSNPQHPQFAYARPLASHAAPVAVVDAAANDHHTLPSQRGAERVWTVAAGLAGLGLWAFLVGELASKFAPPTIF